jgi:outer membrane autotransporter protein
MAAGDYRGKFGAWVSGAYSDVQDDNVSTKFDGNVYSAMAGIDYKVTPRAIIGVAVGYENTDLDTTYNRGTLEADGYTVAPYIGYMLSDSSSVNLTAGYTSLDYDVTRLDPNNSARLTGTTDADRYFIDASVNGKHNLQGNWNLFGKAAVFYASEEKDAYVETESTGATVNVASADNDLGVVSAEAKFAYTMEMVEPYLLTGVSYDFTKDEAPVAAGQSRSSLDDEDFAAKFGAGLNFQLAPNVTGSFEGYTVEFRDDYDEYTFTGGLRVKF